MLLALRQEDGHGQDSLLSCPWKGRRQNVPGKPKSGKTFKKILKFLQ